MYRNLKGNSYEKEDFLGGFNKDLKFIKEKKLMTTMEFNCKNKEPWKNKN